MENSASFFSNRDCEYYPCHTLPAGEPFNCLFCFCPLYGCDCGGGGSLLQDGRKDCSGCTLPHGNGGYEWVLARLREAREGAG